MSRLEFPKTFPEIDEMEQILKKTFEKAWKVDFNHENITKDLLKNNLCKSL